MGVGYCMQPLLYCCQLLTCDFKVGVHANHCYWCAPVNQLGMTLRIAIKTRMIIQNLKPRLFVLFEVSLQWPFTCFIVVISRGCWSSVCSANNPFSSNIRSFNHLTTLIPNNLVFALVDLSLCALIRLSLVFNFLSNCIQGVRWIFIPSRAILGPFLFDILRVLLFVNRSTFCHYVVFAPWLLCQLFGDNLVTSKCGLPTEWWWFDCREKPQGRRCHNVHSYAPPFVLCSTVACTCTCHLSKYALLLQRVFVHATVCRHVSSLYLFAQQVWVQTNLLE